MKPTMIVLAGPNGAGKSTLYETRIAPSFAGPFINADIIQRDELRDPSPAASYEAANTSRVVLIAIVHAHSQVSVCMLRINTKHGKPSGRSHQRPGPFSPTISQCPPVPWRDWCSRLTNSASNRSDRSLDNSRYRSVGLIPSQGTEIPFPIMPTN